ncbi:hypothetical protein BWI97_08165 [Siphonobacter sp. BAB-5405]|nr:hypothetical protein BWI97_08165 [Siphonobacter sp. BAB-5405]
MRGIVPPGRHSLPIFASVVHTTDNASPYLYRVLFYQNRKQKTENRKQKTENRKQKTQNSKPQRRPLKTLNSPNKKPR